MSKSLYEIKYLPSERTWSTTTSRNKIPSNQAKGCPENHKESIVLWTNWDQPQPRTMKSDNGIFINSFDAVNRIPSSCKTSILPHFFSQSQTPKWKTLKWGIGNIELCRVGSDSVCIYDSSTVKRTTDTDRTRKSIECYGLDNHLVLGEIIIIINVTVSSKERMRANA